MTEADQKILKFAAEHRAILTTQIAALLDTTAAEAELRLADLAGQGLIRHHRTHHRQAGHHQITSRGLTAIDSPLPAPRFETIRDYRQDLALPWLTLHARRGRFGTVHRAVTERVMRHHDNTHRARETHPSPAGGHVHEHEPDYDAALGTRLDGTVARHYPDLMLIVPRDQITTRVAVQLHRLPPRPQHLAAQIAAYGADPDIATALYLTTPQHAHTIQATAARLGLSKPTHVQHITFGSDTPITTAQ